MPSLPSHLSQMSDLTGKQGLFRIGIGEGYAAKGSQPSSEGKSGAQALQQLFMTSLLC